MRLRKIVFLSSIYILMLLLVMAAFYWVIRQTARVDFLGGGTLLSSNDVSPKILFERTYHDFGRVVPKVALHADFRFSNAGGQELVVEDIKTSCGCTVANISPKKVSPGGVGVLRIAFTPADARKVRHQVVIHSNDPHSPDVDIVLSAAPSWPIEVRPTELTFTCLMVNETINRELDFVSVETKPFEITHLESSASTVVITPVEQNHRQKKLRVAITPKQIGHFDETISVTTDIRERPRMTIPIRGEVIARAQVTPRSLLLGMRQAGEEIPITLMLDRAPEGGTFSNVSVTSGEWSIVSYNIQSQSANSLQLQIVLRTPSSNGHHASDVILKSLNAEVSVPVSVVIGK